MAYDAKTIKALGTLRKFTAGQYIGTVTLTDAINELDNAGVFAEIDEQTDYDTAVSINETLTALESVNQE